MTINDKRVVKALRSRARKGAEFLDRHRPGWARKVKITKLDMRRGVVGGKHSCGCVLAQLDGGYENGLANLGLLDWGAPDDLPERLGFNQPIEPLYGKHVVSYDAFSLLDEAWKDEIRARRKKAGRS